MANDDDPQFCDPKGSGYLILQLLGVYPDSGTVTQQYTGYSWKSTHFCVSIVVIFYSTSLNFFHSYFKVSTICDEYIRYWNNGMYLSNQVKWKHASGPKRPQVPGLGLKSYFFSTELDVLFVLDKVLTTIDDNHYTHCVLL